MKRVRDTSPGREINAWVVLRNGKVIAKVHYRYSAKSGVGQVDVFDYNNENKNYLQQRKGKYGSASLESCISGLQIDGHIIYDHAYRSAEAIEFYEFYKSNVDKYDHASWWRSLAKEKALDLCNYDGKTFQSCFEVAGLDKLEYLGYKVIQAI